MDSTDQDAARLKALEKIVLPGRVHGYPSNGVHGRIVHDIGHEIVSGVFSPGERLPGDVDLIERFQASRTAIREAMKVLATKGLIDARQRAGTSVRARADWDLLDADVLSWHSPATIGEKLAGDLVELRELIEPVAARLAAHRASEEDIDRMEKAWLQMEAGVDDLELYYAGDVAFHLSVLSACHNQIMQRLDGIIGTVLNLSFEMQKETLVGPHEGLEAHYLIIDRIRARDRRGAERAMRAVIGRAKDEIGRRDDWPRQRIIGGTAG
jgi:GntR family transcriptional regulator, galactonate operon transcriptional repressor